MNALDSKFWENLKYINTDYDNSLEAIMINANLNKLRSMILGFYKNHSQELKSIFASIVNSKELNSIRESIVKSKELKPLAKELQEPMGKLLDLLKKYIDKQWSLSFTTIYNFKKSFFNNLYGKIKAEFDSIKELNKEETEKGDL